VDIPTYTYICTYICIYTCMYICMYLYVYTCITGPAPEWEEIKDSKSGEQHTWTCDLVCLRQQSDDKVVDPALWCVLQCVAVRGSVLQCVAV